MTVQRLTDQHRSVCKLCPDALLNGEPAVWLTKPMGLSHQACADRHGLAAAPPSTSTPAPPAVEVPARLREEPLPPDPPAPMPEPAAVPVLPVEATPAPAPAPAVPPRRPARPRVRKATPNQRPPEPRAPEPVDAELAHASRIVIAAALNVYPAWYCGRCVQRRLDPGACPACRARLVPVHVVIVPRKEPSCSAS